jgi:serine/threonine-protein kinase HipA
MSSKPWEQFVFIHLDGQADAVPAGHLTLLEEGVRPVGSTFTYGTLYQQRSDAIPVDPASAPLSEARQQPGRQFEPAAKLPMFGAIRDAAPDYWGRRVIENKLQAPPNGLPESVYLTQAGRHRTGALDFRPKPNSPEKEGSLPGIKDLSYLLDAAAKIENGEPVPANLQMFFSVGATFGGARPKALLLADGKQWLAKFPAKNDGFNIPVVERATLELARECGLRVPETRHVQLADGRDIMLIERFDRPPLQGDKFGKRHVVSALTMLKLDERDRTGASYVDIANALDQHGAKGFVAEDRRELFKRMVFNVLVTNDDDHLRNHAFVWDSATQGWRLSDLYDVVPKPQQGTERFLVLGIGDKGRLATLDNALSAAPKFGILPQDACALIKLLSSIVREWRVYFEEFDVPAAECEKIKSAFRNPKDIGLAAVQKT